MMKYRTRIYYTEEQKSVMWERWQRGEERNQVSHETIYRSLFMQAQGVLKKELQQ